MEDLRRHWSRSKVYRVILILALIYVVLRLLVQGIYVFMPVLSGDGQELAPYDFRIYLDAAERIQMEQPLYLQEELDRIASFQYTPAFALAFVPFLSLSPIAAVLLFSFFHIVAYVLLFLSWRRIFERLQLQQAVEMLYFTLPVWLVFSVFWSDLGYLNIYVFSALLATLLIEAVLEERLGLALLWLSLILQTKPYWAFPVVILLVLGRWKFFFKLAGLAVIIYVAVSGLTMLIVDAGYGWQQYVDYAQFLLGMRGNFPWRGPDAPYLGYNHSITQAIVYVLGESSSILRLATFVKVVLLAPLFVILVRYIIRPKNLRGSDAPILSLDWAFVLYLGVFIWLDVVWEVFLGIAIFTFLLATISSRFTKSWIWVVFLPYALLDLWQFLSFLVLGPSVVAPGGYVLTDPGIYVPFTMIVILAFYAVLIKRLWTTASAHQPSLNDQIRVVEG